MEEEIKRFKFFDYAYFTGGTWTDLEVEHPDGSKEWAALIMTLEDHKRDLCEHEEHRFIYEKCDNPLPIKLGFNKNIDSEGDTYYTSIYDIKTLGPMEYMDTARKWMNVKGYYDQEFLIEFVLQSQKDIDDEKREYDEWVEKGKPKFKIIMTDEFKQSLKELGTPPDDIYDLQDKIDEQNKKAEEYNKKLKEKENDI